MIALAVVAGILGAVWLVVRTVEVRELRRATLAAETASANARDLGERFEALRNLYRAQADQIADVERATNKHASKLRELMPR